MFFILGPPGLLDGSPDLDVSPGLDGSIVYDSELEVDISDIIPDMFQLSSREADSNASECDTLELEDSASNVAKGHVGNETDQEKDFDPTLSAVVKESSRITVAKTHNEGNTRTYDKLQYCLFCKHPQKKIARHLQTMHKNEQEVEDYVAEEDKTKKSEMLSKLRNIGNHLHNVEVIRKQEGELVVKYQPDEDVPYTDFMPCKSCFAYFGKSSLWKYSCNLAPEGGKRISKRGKILMPVMPSLSKDEDIMNAALLQSMRMDAVGVLLSKDGLILKFGKHMINKLGMANDVVGYIRSKMRQLG